MNRANLVTASLCACLVFGPASNALAYDSRCYLPGGAACAEGPEAARGRWIGPSDEHRQIFVAGLQSAGLPANLNDTLELVIFTDGTQVAANNRSLPTLIPTTLDRVDAVQLRPITAAEFAQLPDFGYSLFDWALGLETCPVDNVDPETCHLFAGHMGALNSNHFLPQAQVFYGHYHSLAVARAAECKATATLLGDQVLRFAEVILECEKEALLLEAVAQHYLQDAWSSGHMWSRWGSPDRTKFPSLLRGVAVAATAGLIHGARALLQPKISTEIIDVPDAMCAPQPEVEWSHPEQGRHAGVGDLYLTELDGDARFVRQHQMLTSCAISGMRAVYGATAQVHGPLRAPTGDLLSVDPVSDDCFGQRATNRAIHRGFGIDVAGVSGPRHIAITPALAGSVVLAGVGAFDPDESAVLGAQFAFDLILLSANLEFSANFDPFGTSLASGGIGSLVDIEPNGAYVTSPPAPYVDPGLPWAPSPRTVSTAPVAALARTFHRGHAAEWCAAFVENATTLDAIRDRAALEAAIAAEVEGSATHQRLVATRDAKCAMCAEFTGRHLRFGIGPNSYDTTREPLCTLLNRSSPVTYGEGATLTEAAQARCGCRGDFVLTLRPVDPVLPLGSAAVCADVARAGVPAAGINVSFSLDGGGSLAMAEVLTGVDGSACTTWSAGSELGVFTVRARLGPAQGGSTVTGPLRVESGSASVFGDYRGLLACTVFDITLPLANRSFNCEEPAFGLILSAGGVGVPGVTFTTNMSSINCRVNIRFDDALDGLVSAGGREFSVETINPLGNPNSIYRLNGAATVAPAQLTIMTFYERSNAGGVVQERYTCNYLGARE